MTKKNEMRKMRNNAKPSMDLRREFWIRLDPLLKPMGFQRNAKGIFTLVSSTQWIVALRTHARVQAGMIIVTPGIRAHRSDVSDILDTGTLDTGLRQVVDSPNMRRSECPSVFATSLVSMLSDLGCRREELIDYRYKDERSCQSAARMLAEDVQLCYEEILKLSTTEGVLRAQRNERRNSPQSYLLEMSALLFAEKRFAELKKFISGLKPQHISPLAKKFFKFLVKNSNNQLL